MKELYARKGQMGADRRYYAEYADALSEVPSYERVTLMGPRERGWKRFIMQDLPGGVIKITKKAPTAGERKSGANKNIQA